MADQSCGNCKFWLYDGQQSVCRRSPPQPFVISASEGPDGRLNMKTTAAWPVTHEGLWCGEWQAKAPATVHVFQPTVITNVQAQDLSDPFKPLGGI